MAFGFQDRTVAEGLRDYYAQVRLQRMQYEQGPAISDSIHGNGYIFMTPSGGIPARSGTTCGKADCTPYIIDTDDELVEVTDSDGASYSIEVFNLATGVVGGSQYIQAKMVSGVPVVDVEYC